MTQTAKTDRFMGVLMSAPKRVLGQTLSVMMFVLLTACNSHAEDRKIFERTLSLSATAELKVQPDSVFINTGITTIAKTAQLSLSQNSLAMTRIMDALKTAGLKREHIQTTNFSVGPHYSRTRQSGNRSVITGFQVVNSVRIEVKNIPALGEILDQVVSLGANQINSISFNITHSQALKEKVQKKVMAKVKAKAVLYAENMGVKLGHILSISENIAQAIPRPYMRTVASDGAARSMSVPIAAGKGRISSTIHVVWALK